MLVVEQFIWHWNQLRPALVVDIIGYQYVTAFARSTHESYVLSTNAVVLLLCSACFFASVFDVETSSHAAFPFNERTTLRSLRLDNERDVPLIVYICFFFSTPFSFCLFFVVVTYDVRRLSLHSVWLTPAGAYYNNKWCLFSFY